MDYISDLLILINNSCLFGLSEPEDGGNILFQNVGSHLREDMV